MAVVVEILQAIFAWILVTIAIIAAFILPTIINIALSTYIGLKITKKWISAIPTIILVSALLSFNVRIPHLASDYFSDDLMPSYEISRKLEVHPSEKILLSTNEDEIFYRSDTSVKGWGFHDNWQLDLYETPMIVERPEWILRDLGLASTNTGSHHASITFHSKVINGRAYIRVVLRDEYGISATYKHVARRNIGIDNLNSSGEQIDPWRGYVSLFTQRTPWNWSINYYPKSFTPLADFLSKAVVLKGSEKAPSSVEIQEPTLLSVLRSERLLNVQDDRFAITHHCEGADRDVKYSVTATSHSVSVIWADRDYPPLLIKIGPFDGFYHWNNVSSCSGNKFVITTLIADKALARTFEVDSSNRQATLKEWVQLPSTFPTSSRQAKSRLFLNSLKSGIYEFVFVRYQKTTVGPRRFVATEGERIFATAAQSH